MRGRVPVGYVVRVDGTEVVLNLLDVHRGQVAAHFSGVSPVTEVGSLLAIDSGNRLLVFKVLTISFDEPRDAHRQGVGSSSLYSEPLRNISGVIVGHLRKDNGNPRFMSDGLSSPGLGAEAYPMTSQELAAAIGTVEVYDRPIQLGEDMRGGGKVNVGLESLLSRHVAVLGGSGQGKSCFTAAVLQQIAQLENSRVVIFDINGEYEQAFSFLQEDLLKKTVIGGNSADSFRIPYYALGRGGLNRLLMPSEKTQRPALAFALEHLNKLKWFPNEKGSGLQNQAGPVFFSDCQPNNAVEANNALAKLRAGIAEHSSCWPPMSALATLVADCHSVTFKGNTYQRDAFLYGNVAPLITRINRFIDDKAFTDVVDVRGGALLSEQQSWDLTAKEVVERLFGGPREDWRIHVINMSRVSHDLMPFVFGSILELYAEQLFLRGPGGSNPTLLVLEEAHHYMRPIGSGEEANENSLAYERLAKEGRKFGLGLWLSTQRPSEISPTVLSQCNNWIVFRLTSERDLSAVQSASEWADRREIRRISSLARQNAVVFGGSLPMPVMIRAADAFPLPRSSDGAFRNWGRNSGKETF